MDVEDLKALSALLDTALELDEREREPWLRGLRGDALRMVPVLRVMLARGSGPETADLIERAPVFTMPAEALAGEATAFAAGDSVGPYRLLRLLGAGGMGEVWLAELADGQIRRQVALKLPMLTLRRSVLVQRFARERDILASLQHPNIARLYDAGLSTQGQPYLALEFVEGQPITDYCSAHRLALRERVILVMQVAQALHYAHSHLVVHRDLKPGNVLVRADGTAMLLDFGIAKLIETDQSEAAETELTRQGGRPLTLAYAAPEQLSGAPVSTAADVHALGLLLYELAAGTRPFAGSRHEVEAALLTREPPRPKGVPADLVTVMLKALKKAPAERYASASAFHDELGRWLRGEAILARGDSPGYRLRRFVGRHRLAVGSASALLLTIVGTSAVALWQASLARSEARTAAAVQNFIEGVFRANTGEQADPVRARQRTARELLDEGTRRIDAELEGAPEAKLRVLRTLAAMYGDMAESEPAARLLDQVVEIESRLQPQPSASRVRAIAHAATAHTSAGDEAAARRHLASGRALLRAMGAADDPAHGAEIALNMAELDLARHHRDPAAIALAERTLDLLAPRGPSPEQRDTQVLLAALLSSNGQAERAVALLRQAAGVHEQLGTRDGKALALILGELASAEIDLGLLAQAEATLRKQIAHTASHIGPDSAAAARVWVRLAGLLASGGRPREALAIFERLRQRPRQQPGGATQIDHDLAFEARGEALAWWKAGQPARALALLDAPDTVRPGPSSGQFLAIDWLLLRAQALTTLGRFAAARAEIDAAEALRAQRKLGSRRLAARQLRAGLELELAMRQPGAAVAAWAQHAPRDPPESIWLAERAELALLRGDVAAAATAARDALALLDGRDIDIGATEARQRLQHALGAALLQAGQPVPARAALQQAVDLDAAMRDADTSPQRLAALTLLAQAQARLGERAAAASTAAQARLIRRRHAELGPQFGAAR